MPVLSVMVVEQLWLDLTMMGSVSQKVQDPVTDGVVDTKLPRLNNQSKEITALNNEQKSTYNILV